MNKYSQYDEQAAILKAFEGRERPGTFCDIGAYHPTEFSNTRALYELGWIGVMFEPSPGPMLALLKGYGLNDRVTLVQAAVGYGDDLVLMHVTDDAVSTTKNSEYEKWKGTASFHGSMLVPVVTLETIGNRFGGFDFINFDAEGFSVNLFHRALKIGWRPHCACVEHDGRLEELLSTATVEGYSATYSNGTNVVLVRG